jgi:hypothetical protein
MFFTFFQINGPFNFPNFQIRTSSIFLGSGEVFEREPLFTETSGGESARHQEIERQWNHQQRDRYIFYRNSKEKVLIDIKNREVDI